MKLLDGKLLADKILKDVEKKVRELRGRYIAPSLAIILIGSDPASVLYTSIKKKKAEQIGIKVKIHRFSNRVSQQNILALIDRLNNDKKVTGILVQMPIPERISREKVIWAIAPHKDVDGFQMHMFLPPAPVAILELLHHYGINLAKKRVLIIGNGFLIGKPLSTLALRHGAKVTVADSSTSNLANLTQESQIIIAVTGKPNIVTADMLKAEQIVIDAGGKQVDGKFIGDVDFDAVKTKVAAITPNPGGIGPLTVAILASNVVKAASMTKVTNLP